MDLSSIFTFVDRYQKKVQLILLSGIILLGFSLRVYKLDIIPYGFFCDEAATGYNAYSIFHTGKDEYHVSYPLFFHSFGNDRPPIPIYSAIPFIALFGLTEFSTRLASAFLGTFSILLIYLLAKEVFTKFSFLPLTSAFMLAISPWQIQFSRVGMENIYLPFFMLLGIYLFFLGIKRHTFFLLASSLAFGSGIFTYFPAYFMIPVVIFLLICIYWKSLLAIKKASIRALMVFILICLPFCFSIAKGDALGRLSQGTSFLKNYHTPLAITQKLGNSYAQHFSWEFLFTKGDAGLQAIQRHSVLGMGMLYLFEFPFLIVSIIYIATYIKRKDHQFLLVLLLVYPLGSTFGDTINPFATRSIFGSFVFPLYSAYGIHLVLHFIKNSKIKILYMMIVSLIIFFFFTNYLSLYFNKYPLQSSGYWGWQAGPRDIMNIFKKEQAKYDELFIMGYFNAPEIFVKFYDPENKCNSKCKIGDIKNLNPNKKQLFAIEFDRLKEKGTLQFTTKQIISYPNGQPAFYIGELKQ